MIDDCGLFASMVQGEAGDRIQTVNAEEIYP
jgi:hypothetical protein